MSAAPAALYEARLATVADDQRRAQRRHDMLAWLRVATLVGFVVTAYQACGHHGGGFAAVGVSVAIFVALSIAIGRVGRALARAADATRYYQAGLGRLRGDWSVRVSDGTAFEPADHPFAADLDLFGPQSLFALLCTARTATGQRTLAEWLSGSAPEPQEVRARQAAVLELRDRVALREGLWRAAGRLDREVRADTLGAWLAADVVAPKPGARWAAAGLAVLGAVAVAALLVERPFVAFLIFPIEFLFARQQSPRSRAIGLAAQSRADELAALAGLAGFIESETFVSPRLVALRAALSSHGLPARQRIGQLARRVGWYESRRNPFYGLLSAPFLATTQFALAIDAWRARHGRTAAGWLQAVGELEALASLATYAFEHPDQPFPTIVEDAEGPLYQGTDLAHPLLPAASRVGNDVALDRQQRLLLVTGSNMSGKSTLLRTVGANAVLAMAGAPVVARELRLSRLSLGATLRTSDSLQAGVSRFFAEIKRLRTIVTLTEASPLTLFLLDEILHGTNSQDRFAGASALVRTLVDRGAIGLVTTHDLTLAAIVDELAPAARNVHLEDLITDGELRFDYRLRPGVVERGNALALMKLVGLPV